MPRTLRRHQSVTLSLLFLAGIVNLLDRGSLSIANSTVRAEMHLSATQMGWILSAFSVSYGLAQLPLVGLLDRAGTRAVLGAGIIVWSTAQMLTGLLRGLPAFLGLRILLGIGEAPFYPAGIRSVREWFPPAARGRATAVMNSSQAIGLAIAPPALTTVMLAFGWRAMFVVLGMAGLIVAVLWIALHKGRGDTEFAEPLPPLPITHNPQPVFLLLLRQRTVWGMMLGWGGINYTVWLYLAWLPDYLQNQRHLSLAHTGLLAAIPYLGGGVGMFCSGFITDWLAARGKALTTVHRVNIVAGMVVSAAATFFVASAATTTQAVAGLTIAFFFIHYAGTSGWGYVQCVTPLRFVASLGSLQNSASYLIASTAPILTGWLLDRTRSFTIALGVCSLIALLGALSYATLAAPSGMHLEEA